MKKGLTDKIDKIDKIKNRQNKQNVQIERLKLEEKRKTFHFIDGYVFSYFSEIPAIEISLGVFL